MSAPGSQALRDEAEYFNTPLRDVDKVFMTAHSSSSVTFHAHNHIVPLSTTKLHPQFNPSMGPPQTEALRRNNFSTISAVGTSPLIDACANSNAGDPLLHTLTTQEELARTLVQRAIQVPKGQSIFHNGRQMTQRALLLEALRLSPHSAWVYTNLAATLDEREAVVLVYRRPHGEEKLIDANAEARTMDYLTVSSHATSTDAHSHSSSSSSSSSSPSHSSPSPPPPFSTPTICSFFSLTQTIANKADISGDYLHNGAMPCTPDNTTITDILCAPAVRHTPLTTASEHSIDAPIFSTLMANKSITLTKELLYLEALRCDPCCSVAYDNLGILLGKLYPPKERILLPGGQSLCEQELYLQAIYYDANCSSAYNNLAVSLEHASDTVDLLDGRRLTKRDLYMEAVRCNPSWALPYNNLGISLNPLETVTLSDGRILDRRTAFVESLVRDPVYAEAYCNLGSILDDGERIVMPILPHAPHRRVLEESCSLRAPWTDMGKGSAGNLDSESAGVCLPGAEVNRSSTRSISSDLQSDQPINEDEVCLKGWAWSKRELLLESLRHDPDCGLTYNNLAATLGTWERVILPDGRDMGKQELFVEALRLDSSCAFAYCNLGSHLEQMKQMAFNEDEGKAEEEADEQLIHEDGKIPSYTPNIRRGSDSFMPLPQLQARSVLHLDRSYQSAGLKDFFGNSVILSDGRILNEQQLYIEAIRCKPDHSLAYINLARTLSLEHRGAALGLEAGLLHANAINKERWMGTAQTEGPGCIREENVHGNCNSTGFDCQDVGAKMRGSEFHLRVQTVTHDDDMIVPDMSQLNSNGPTFIQTETPTPAYNLHCPQDLACRCSIEKESHIFHRKGGNSLSMMTTASLSGRLDHLDMHLPPHEAPLSSRASFSDSVVLVDGRSLTKRDCYVEALRFDPGNADVYVLLANTLENNEFVFLDGGARRLTRCQLYQEALLYDPNCAEAYFHLAFLVPTPSSKLELADGRVLSGAQLWSEVMRCQNRRQSVALSQATPVHYEETSLDGSAEDEGSMSYDGSSSICDAPRRPSYRAGLGSLCSPYITPITSSLSVSASASSGKKRAVMRSTPSGSCSFSTTSEVVGELHNLFTTMGMYLSEETSKAEG